jgi:hypothetical protein
MAIAGDVVINFAANFATFSEGMKQATASLDKFGEQAAQTNSKLDSAFAFLKGAGIAAGIGIVVNELKKLGEASQQASLEIANQAQKLGITTNQYQAYQLQAKQAGVSVEEVTKQLKDNGAATDQLIKYYQSLGLIIDSEAIAKFERMNAAAEESERRINAVIAPLYAAAREIILDKVATALERIRDIVGTMDVTKLDTILKLMQFAVNPGAIGAQLGATLLGAGPSPTANKLEELNDQITVTVNRIAALRNETAKPMPMIDRGKEIEMLEKKLTDLQAQRAGLTKDIPQLPPVVVTGTRDKSTLGGGGGKTDADSMEAQIARFRALAEAQGRIYNNTLAAHSELVEDLQREYKIQQQIEETAAKLGAKYSQASDEQKKRLKEEIEGWLRSKEAIDKYIEARRMAEDLDAKQGGNAARRRLDDDVAKLRRGGASETAINRFLKEQEEQLNQNALAARRYDDDLGSLAAGFELAADRFARANDMFTMGGNIFNSLTNAMGEGLEVLAGRSSKTFEQIAADFAMMLAKMALQAALSQVFKAVFGSLFSASAAPIDPSAAMSQYATAADWWKNPGFDTTRAGGGDVYPGQVYRVGEYGPETFVPTAAGRIEPWSANGSRGGDNITVNMDMGTTRGASDPASIMAFGRKIQAAVKDVIANEKRPGGTLYNRVSA